MAVCLIIPPSIFLLDERVFMTLGILKVAAVLEQRVAAIPDPEERAKAMA